MSVHCTIQLQIHQRFTTFLGIQIKNYKCLLTWLWKSPKSAPTSVHKKGIVPNSHKQGYHSMLSGSHSGQVWFPSWSSFLRKVLGSTCTIRCLKNMVRVFLALLGEQKQLLTSALPNIHEPKSDTKSEGIFQGKEEQHF